MKASTILEAHAALRAVQLLPVGEPVPHPVWVAVMHAAGALSAEIEKIAIDVPVETAS